MIPTHLYPFSIALIFGWLVFSFVFWKSLRNQGIEEDRIFDLTFYATIWASIGARSAYVLFHWSQFSDNPIRIAALWVAPGLSLYGALLAGLFTLVYLSRGYKVRVGHVLDAFGISFGLACIIGALGMFLQTGKPIVLYEVGFLFGVIAVQWYFIDRARQKKWPFGMVGLWFFALFTVGEFALEFFKDSRVYLGYIRANQWVLIALFAETMGAFYVRGGGREMVRPIINRIIGGIHGAISKRRS